MRRYSSMTSVYSMSINNCNLDQDEGMVSSEDDVTGSTGSPNDTSTTYNDSTPTPSRPPKLRSLSHDE